MNEEQESNVKIHKIGNITNPATEDDIKSLVHDINQLSDTKMLDWLQ